MFCARLIYMKSYAHKVIGIFLIAGCCCLFIGCRAQKATTCFRAERDPLFAAMEHHCPPLKFEGIVEDWRMSPSLSSFEICDSETLVDEIKHPTNAFLRFIKESCSKQTLAEFDKPNKHGLPGLTEVCLRSELNKIINGPLIFNNERFSGIELRKNVREILAAAGYTKDCAHLNRLLLEDALPEEISRLPRKMVPELYSAVKQHTNYVAILIKHGADAKGAERLLREQGEEQAADFLSKIEAVLKVPPPTNPPADGKR